jgi:hypothetical protein
VRENTREKEYISGVKGKNRIHSVSFQFRNQMVLAERELSPLGSLALGL